MAERVLLGRLPGPIRQRGKRLAISVTTDSQTLGPSGPESSRQAPDQPGQCLGTIRPADPKPVLTGKLNRDRAVGDRVASSFGRGVTHDLDRQETRCLRRAWRKPKITHPVEDQIAFNRYRRATRTVSAIQRGHYFTVSRRGRAVRPDGYGPTARLVMPHCLRCLRPIDFPLVRSAGGRCDGIGSSSGSTRRGPHDVVACVSACKFDPLRRGIGVNPSGWTTGA